MIVPQSIISLMVVGGVCCAPLNCFCPLWAVPNLLRRHEFIEAHVLTAKP